MPAEANDLDSAIASIRNKITAYCDLNRLRSLDATVIVDRCPDRVAGGLKVSLGRKAKTRNNCGDRDPLFGGVNPETDRQQTRRPQRTCVDTKALVGLATDGDADRVGA